MYIRLKIFSSKNLLGPLVRTLKRFGIKFEAADLYKFKARSAYPAKDLLKVTASS
jgi:hypothetical protein